MRAGTNEAAGPMVSVVMPVHNGARHLDEAVRSIRGQTLRDLELVVVENGSTDDSFQMASRHAAEDARVRVLRLEQANLVRALNAGLKAARADWVACMDQDDVSHPRRLERQMAFLSEHPDVKALGTYASYIGESGRVVGISRQGPTTREEFQKQRERGLIILVGSSVVFARQLALDLGGYREEFVVSQDVDLWSRIADQHQVLALPELLVSYRVHASALSTRRLRDQLRTDRWATLNTFRRRAGQPELSSAEFDRHERARPLWQRIRDELTCRSLGYYRFGGGLLAGGDARGALYLGLSFLCWPALPMSRLRDQGVLASAGAALGRASSQLTGRGPGWRANHPTT